MDYEIDFEFLESVVVNEIGVKYQELEKLLDTGEVCFGSYVLESISKNVSQGPL